MNRYPLWKYILILVIIAIGFLYALPNLYGKDPALQISATGSAQVTKLTEAQVKNALKDAKIKPTAYDHTTTGLIVRFKNPETQLRAQSVVELALGSDYVVALNLAPATPEWLRIFGAYPMSLGLDLRGGVHFLMQVDMAAAVRGSEERYVSDIRTLLRTNDIRYRSVQLLDKGANKGSLLIRFRTAKTLQAGRDKIRDEYSDLNVKDVENADNGFELMAKLKEKAVLSTKKFALQQNITTLRKRVNELGVSEPVIQQQGQSEIVVELPGVQDTTRAKEILGATATLEFHMVDQEHNVQDAISGHVPPGSALYYGSNKQPYLLRKQVMLTGDYIIDAASGIDSQSGGPDVSITLDGKGAKIFAAKTRDEVGKSMAVVFIENKQETYKDHGVLKKRQVTSKRVIEVATILEQLGKRFQITGIPSTREARNLALLLRAGALAAPVSIVEERTVGPSLGQDNINTGFRSCIIGLVVIMVFMALYYKVFGLAADVALMLNVVLIVAMLSLLPTALTMPGIAGIVLTVGMSVDANVLIFERIREEIRHGNTPQTSIHAGYEKAFSTIADSNITTLIAALALFIFGTGPIKGFAVVLSLGIISSMFTAIMVTRAITNLLYGGRKLSKITI